MVKGGRGGTKKNRVTSTTKAGLTFSVARTGRHARKMKLAKRYGAGAPVYLTAVLEYLAAEILELSGNKCRENHKKIITQRHLLLAVSEDEELNKFFDGTIAGGGVLPNINNVLLPLKAKEKAKKDKQDK